MKLTAPILATLLAACAGAPAYPDSQKLRNCQYEATKATAGGGNYGTNNWVAQGYAEGMAYRRVLDACMARQDRPVSVTRWGSTRGEVK